MRLIPLAALLLLAFPIAACAQDTAAVAVHAGSSLVNAGRVAVRADTFEMSFDNGGEALLVIRTALLGDSALLRVERISAGPRPLSTDSFAARLPTLEPLYDDEDTPSSHRHFTFNAGRVFGKITENGAARPVTTTLTPPAFYLNTSDLLLASLPLAQGRVFDVAMWGPASGAYVLHARVARTEVIPTIDGGHCEAWRVETTGEHSEPSVYWVEKRSQSLLAYAAGSLQIRIRHHPACPAGSDTQRSTR